MGIDFYTFVIYRPSYNYNLYASIGSTELVSLLSFGYYKYYHEHDRAKLRK